MNHWTWTYSFAPVPACTAGAKWRRTNDEKVLGRERAASFRISQEQPTPIQACKTKTKQHRSRFARTLKSLEDRVAPFLSWSSLITRRTKKQEAKKQETNSSSIQAHLHASATQPVVDMDHNRCRVSPSLSLSFFLFVSILIAVTVRDRSHYRLSLLSATFSHHHHHPSGEENAARCVCGLRTLALVRLARLRIISQRLFINAWSLAWRTGSSTSWAMDALTGPD